MDELITSDEPFNPYSGAFFGLWALVALFMIGVQFTNPSSGKSAKNWHQERQTEQITRTKQLSAAPPKLATISQPERPRSTKSKRS